MCAEPSHEATAKADGPSRPDSSSSLPSPASAERRRLHGGRVSEVSRTCLGRVWEVSRKCLGRVSDVSRTCLGRVSDVSRTCLGLLPEKLSDQMKAGRRADALKSSVREHSSAAGKSGGGALAASLSVPRKSSGPGGGTGESNERRRDATSDTDTASAAGDGRMQRNRCPLASC